MWKHYLIIICHNFKILLFSSLLNTKLIQLIYIFLVFYAGRGCLLTIFFKWNKLEFGFIRSEIFLARPEGKLSAITISRSKKKTSLEIHFSFKNFGTFLLFFLYFSKENIWNISVFITLWGPLLVKTKGKWKFHGKLSDHKNEDSHREKRKERLSRKFLTT